MKKKEIKILYDFSKSGLQFKKGETFNHIHIVADAE